MKANQANQEISNLGKDNVNKKPLDAAKNKLSLWSLFLFNTKFSHPVTRFYLMYTFGADLHARKISLVCLTKVKILQSDMKLQPWFFFYTMSNIFNPIKKNKEIKFNKSTNEVAYDLKDRGKIKKALNSDKKTDYFNKIR
jgi:hypothetical protein